MKFYSKIFILSLLLACMAEMRGNAIFSSPELQAVVLNKIDNREWAYHNFRRMIDDVEPFAMRFRAGDTKDPAWLTSRYAMNWLPGKHYTQCQTDEQGTKILKLSGNAPVPTVAYCDSHYPQTPNGVRYELPPIEQFLSLRHRETVPMINPETGKTENIPINNVANDVNREINNLVLKSAILYWLTQKEEYGYMAADIFQLWSLGAYHQLPVDSCSRSGYFSLESVEDGAYRDLLLAYDFIRPFFNDHAYDTRHHQTVFERIAETILQRGATNNNWSALSASSLVFAALNLEDKEKQKNYITHFIERDTINGKVGHISLKRLIEKNFSPEGYWKESPADHNRSLHELLIAALACEQNGYTIFKRFPILLNSAHILMSSAFPDGTLPNYGDTEHQYPYFSNIVMAMYQSRKMKHSSVTRLASAAWELISKQQPRDKDGYWINLLFGSNTLAEMAPPYQWSSSGKIDYAKYFFLRNGKNPTNALMAGLRGASYMHNHSDALAVEFYGKGMTMGIDPGMGRSLRDPLHVEYYSQWGAHNTVVPAGSATAERLYKGGDVSKNIGQIDLNDIEATLYDEPNGAKSYSFFQARYFERFTKTQQNRTIGLVRLNEKNGYYVDFFTSNNALLNDYIYHNVGDTLRLLNFKRQPIQTKLEQLQIVPPDFPGLRYLKNGRTTGKYSEGLVAQFPATLPDERAGGMQVLIPATSNRRYYATSSPAAVTANERYAHKSLPTLIMRQEGEAVNPPFACILEPYAEEEGYAVDSVIWLPKTARNKSLGLKVFLKNGDMQIIVKAPYPKEIYRDSLLSFVGEYMVLSYSKGQLHEIYVGKGKTLTIGQTTLSQQSKEWSASIIFENGIPMYRTTGTVFVEPIGKFKTLTITDGNKKTTFKPKAPVKTRKGRRRVTVPAKQQFIVSKMDKGTIVIK